MPTAEGQQTNVYAGNLEAFIVSRHSRKTESPGGTDVSLHGFQALEINALAIEKPQDGVAGLKCCAVIDCRELTF